nr:MAG TPA: hypothetical protein [Caudoviricetes sp.]
MNHICYEYLSLIFYIGSINTTKTIDTYYPIAPSRT